MSFLREAVIFLLAAVILVPLFKRLGISAVLGYLAAGVMIGPWAFGFVVAGENVLHFAELGVVLLLFIIGLELQPSRLWALRKTVFGLGGAQVALTGAALALAGIVLGLPWTSALIVGLILSSSSTAMVLQLLAEKKQLSTQYGRAAFGILLFQDLAAIPLLAIIPVLGAATIGTNSTANGLAIAKAIALIAAVVIGGRWLLRPLLRLVALAAYQEIFTAAALLVVIGTAWLMQQVGLSMALGAFLAGVLLAESEYRHELEADIEPFKGLLLGLFFIAVGITADLGLVLHRPLTVLGLVAGLMLVKGLVLYAIARRVKHNIEAAIKLALYLSQGGEFVFVLLGVATGAHLIDTGLSSLLVVVVSVSMALTPLLVTLNAKVLKLGCAAELPRPFDDVEEKEHRVIIAGFGRFGQIVARTLRTKKVPFTVLESSFEQVEFVRKFGNKVYFGDASRLDLLRAAHAEKAQAFVLAIDDPVASVKTAQMVKTHYPHLKIYARARNRMHAYQLMDIGVEHVERETLLASLEVARVLLQGLGFTAKTADEAARRFRAHDANLLKQQHKIYRDEAQLIASARQGAEELERLFEEDSDATSTDSGTPASK
jgi:monovalent cation:proton antiporter-2 (CPA2) family protein